MSRRKRSTLLLERRDLRRALLNAEGEGALKVDEGVMVVEVSGLEPLTFWLPARRSPS